MFYLNSRSKSLKVNLNIAKNQCFTINYMKDKKKLGKKNKKRKTEGGLKADQRTATWYHFSRNKRSWDLPTK